MTPVRIEGAAVPLNAPANWSEEEHGRCATLWVRLDNADGLPFMRSAWEASSDEIGWLLAGAKVQLGISGTAHPVVQLGLGPIPDHFAPPVTIEQGMTPQGGRTATVSMFFADGRKVVAGVLIGAGSLAPAIALAIEEIEAVATREGLLP